MKLPNIAILASICLTVPLSPVAAEENGTAVISRYCKTWTGSHFGNSSKKAGQAALAALGASGTFSKSELELIKRRKVKIGMRELAAICAIGYHWYDLKKLTTANGVQKQYAIGDGSYNLRWFLYVENGVGAVDVHRM